MWKMYTFCYKYSTKNYKKTYKKLLHFAQKCAIMKKQYYVLPDGGII